MSEENHDDETLKNFNTQAVDLFQRLNSTKTYLDSLIESASQSIQSETERFQKANAEIQILKENASNANSEIENLKSAATQNVSITSAAVAEIEQAKTGYSELKGSLDATRETASTDLGIIIKIKSDIETLKATAETQLRSLATDNENIKKEVASLQETNASLYSILSDLSAARNAAEADKSQITALTEEVKIIRDGFSKINDETQTRYESLTQKQDNLQLSFDEIDAIHLKALKLRERLLDGTEDTRSVQEEIDQLYEQTQQQLIEIKNEHSTTTQALESIIAKSTSDTETQATAIKSKFNQLHQSLEEKILSLLPSAGAAGLASTYYDAKSRYSPTSYTRKSNSNDTNKSQNWLMRTIRILRSLFGNNPASAIATVFFYTMFIAPLGTLAYGTYELVLQLEGDKEVVLDNRILILRFLVAVPLATISAFGFSSLRLYRKLYEEYNHKQRVMELYRSFRDEIATNGDPEQTKELLKIMLDSVATKAWEDGHNSDDKAKDTEANAMLSQMSDLYEKCKKAFPLGD